MRHPYATRAYAAALGHIGSPFEVPEWGCSVLVRPIEGGHSDITGTYPLTILAAGADLPGGLERLRGAGFISAILVLDDFHRPPLPELEAAFDIVQPFKPHFLHRPSRGAPILTKHHRYEVRRALRSVVVRALDLAAEAEAETWNLLYGCLRNRHRISESHLFGPDHIRDFGRLSGTLGFGAFLGEELVSAHFWVAHCGFVHSHLAASSSRGYNAGAAYAVNAVALDAFAAAEVVNLGGGAGILVEQEDGLTRFKRGFSNEVASSYICGAILRPDLYRMLVDAGGVSTENASFFPGYRTRRGAR